MVKGIVFDMDGVLVDSEKYICKAAMMMFAERGVEVKAEDFLPFVGAGEDRYVGGVAEKYNLDWDIQEIKARTYQIYGEIVHNNLEPLPGVLTFIKKAREKGLKLAVATSADKIKMETNLREIGISADTFDAVVNGLDVVNKKPNPEIFLKAIEKLGLKPEECLVVEDAVNGVKAAKSAGAKCLALMTSFTKEELNGADWFANTLADAPDEATSW
ncbi:MAG: HAD-IA family hydrolase [Armatimonadota bacterium]